MSGTLVSRRLVLGGMVVGTGVSMTGVTVPSGQPGQIIPRTRIGINESDASIDGFSDPWRDWSKKIQWRAFGSASGTNGYDYVLTPDQPQLRATDVTAAQARMGYDGIIHAAGHYRALLGFYLTAEHQGAGTIIFAPGTTIVQAHGAADIRVSGRSVKFRTASPTDHLDIELKYDGSNPGGLTMTLTDAGTSGSTTTSAKLRSNFAAARTSIWRPMTIRGVNGDTVPDRTLTHIPLRPLANRWTGPVGMGPLTIEDAVAFCNETNHDLWWNFSHLADTDTIAFEARYAARNLNTGSLWEYSNEPWNDAGAFSQGRDMALMGLRAGYAPDAVTNASQATPTAVIDGRTLIVNGVTQAAFKGGDLIFNGVVFRALRDVPSGTTMPAAGAGDANFATLYDYTQASAKARFAYQSQRTTDAGAIIKQAFHSAGKPLPLICLGTQAYNDPNAVAKPLLDWGSTAANIDRLSIAPYWGFVGGVDITNNYSPDVAGWTAADRAAFASGDSDALAKFFAIQHRAVDHAIATAVAWKDWLARYLVAKNGGNASHRNDVLLNFYEFNVAGAGFNGFPTGIDAAIKAALRDPRQGAVWTHALTGMREHVGGEMMIFHRVNVALSARVPWTMAETEDDYALTGSATNHRVKAVADWIAANP